MTKKVIVAKSGYNALTETDPNNLNFDSSYNTLKYYASGTTSFTINYSGYYLTDYNAILGRFYYHRKTTSIAHNLGYVPFFLSYALSLTGSVYSLLPISTSDAGYYAFIQSYADDTNIYFVVEMRNQSASGTQDFSFSYKIFKNNLGI